MRSNRIPGGQIPVFTNISDNYAMPSIYDLEKRINTVDKGK